MNTTTKILVDVLVSTAKMLDKIYSAPDPFVLVQESLSEIDMILQEASEALAMIKPEDHGGNTWVYDGGDPVCDGESCRLSK